MIVLISVLLAAGLLWLRDQNEDQALGQDLPEELRDEPDLYVNDAVIHQFRASGARKYMLQASVIKHFNNSELTRLEQPDLLLEPTTKNETAGDNPAFDSNRPGSSPWRATSDFGYVRKRPGSDGVIEEVVFLRQNVELSQTQEPPRYLSMKTRALYLYPDREYVETDESVTIDTHTGRTKAETLRGDLQTGVLHLTGETTQVQTIVLPFQFK